MIAICPQCHSSCEIKHGKRSGVCPKCGTVCKISEVHFTDTRDFIG